MSDGSDNSQLQATTHTKSSGLGRTMPARRRRGRPKVDPQLDVWFGVEDARERKRIQDRLAQRARRIRRGPPQAKGPNTASSTSRGSGSPEEDSTNISSSCSPISKPCGPAHGPATDLILLPTPRILPPANNSDDDDDAAEEEVILLTESYALLPLPWKILCRRDRIPMTADHRLLCWPAWAIYAALGNHGLMQGTTCCQGASIDAPSPAEYLSLPEPLRPTPLQLAVTHRRWIDRFPFPRMRDNMILLTGLIDLDEFVRDLFGMASLVPRLGVQRLTWDPRHWTIGPEFAAKWGYLFT